MLDTQRHRVCRITMNKNMRNTPYVWKILLPYKDMQYMKMYLVSCFYFNTAGLPFPVRINKWKIEEATNTPYFMQ